METSDLPNYCRFSREQKPFSGTVTSPKIVSVSSEHTCVDLGSCGATAPDSALHVMTDMLGNCGINSFP